MCLAQNRPSNRVNTTERLAALRSEMNRANVQAYIINNNDDNGVSDLTTRLGT